MKSRPKSRSGILPLEEKGQKRRDAASTLSDDQLPKLLDELNSVLSA